MSRIAGHVLLIILGVAVIAAMFLIAVAAGRAAGLSTRGHPQPSPAPGVELATGARS